MALTSSPVGAAHTERAAEELLNEFFKAHFTGEQPQDFPKVDILFNQAVLPEAQPNPQIHCVFLNPTTHERTLSATERIVQTDAMLAIYVRVANKGSNRNDADFICRRIADNVKTLFQSSARADLTRRGILKPRLRRGPTPGTATAHQMRLLVVECQFRYVITVA